MRETINEIIYKPYSLNIIGYIIRITDCVYIIINKALSKFDMEKAQIKLTELSSNYQNNKLVLLTADGKIHTTDNLNFLEMSE